MRRFSSLPVADARLPSGDRLELHVAVRFRERLLGLAGLAALPPGRGLLIPGCSSVHTFGMRFVIDVAFVGWPPRCGRVCVLDVWPCVKPLRVIAARGSHGRGRRGVAAIELPAGSAARLACRREGDPIVLCFGSAEA